MIAKHPDTSKRLLSQVFALSRQALYPRELALPPKDMLLKEQILSVLSEFPSYGYRRVALALGLGKKRVRRVMRQSHIKPYKRMGRWRKRRDERRAPAPYQNEIKNQCPLTPNYVWVGDFTYLPFKGKFLYLATFMDLYTREIVGYHISRRHDKNLVMQAFLDGIAARGFTKPKYLHTDQGAEYTSGDYSKLAESLGVQVSMSKKASPWENGYQESFYNNFKTDLGLEFDRFDHEGHFLEEIHHTLYKYNHKRIHTSLNMPPATFHANYLHSVSQKRGA